jgi:hypothetical protein
MRAARQKINSSCLGAARLIPRPFCASFSKAAVLLFCGRGGTASGRSIRFRESSGLALLHGLSSFEWDRTLGMLYKLLAIYPCSTPAASKKSPAIVPSALIPSASVDAAPGKSN